LLPLLPSLPLSLLPLRSLPLQLLLLLLLLLLPLPLLAAAPARSSGGPPRPGLISIRGETTI